MDSIARIEDRIIALLVERLHLAAPPRDADLFAEGVLDSLYVVDLLLHLEREFGVTIAPEDLDLGRFRSVVTIAGFVAERQRAHSRRPEAAATGDGGDRRVHA